MLQKIAIQGYPGSFHEMAARLFRPDEAIEILPCDTFRQVVQAAENPSLANGAVMAIENSIAGGILPNYNLLRNSKATIIGEVYLPIVQNLLVNRGVKLQDIKEVHSHPMALLQCMDYMAPFHWKPVETEDTALSARRLQESQSKATAVIASSLAATLYDLQVIAPSIQSISQNYTRFWMLQPAGNAAYVPQPDKATLYFQTQNHPGTLATVLDKIARHHANLSSIQSFPIPSSDWEYGFYTDMAIESHQHLDAIIQDIAPHLTYYKILGAYQAGPHGVKASI